MTRRTGLLAVAIGLVLLAGVGSVVRYELGYPLDPFDVLTRRSTAEGRRELRALRRDPVLDFRAPGARLRSTSEMPAGRDWWNSEQPTEIRRLFTLAGEPGEAVDAYRRRAQAAGWQLIETRCSFELRSTSVLLTRAVDGRPAMLHVYGSLERPPPESGIRSLLVDITGEAADRPADGPEGAELRRRDVDCLRHLDPGDPALLPPTRLAGSPAEVCGLLAAADARGVAPAATPVAAGVNQGLTCYYGDPGKGGFVVRAADLPRAHYLDRQAAQDPGDGRFILVAEDTTTGPSGAWVATRIGPVEVSGGATSTRPGLDTRQLVALAELLARA